MGERRARTENATKKRHPFWMALRKFGVFAQALRDLRVNLLQGSNAALFARFHSLDALGRRQRCRHGGEIRRVRLDGGLADIGVVLGACAQGCRVRYLCDRRQR